MNKTVQLNLVNGVTLLAKMVSKDRKIVSLSEPLMIQRYLTETGESFSMMSFTPYQLDQRIDIAMDKIVAVVDIDSPKIVEIYEDYIKNFVMSLEANVSASSDVPEEQEQRTIH